MRNMVVRPVIGGLLAIIVVGLCVHNGAAPLGARGLAASGTYHSGCAFAASSASISPTLIGAMIRHGVHC
jgi:hypothetical protein